MLMAAFALLLAGIFSIATTSIAIECYNENYNKNEETKKKKEGNFTFVIINLISAIFTVLLAFACMYFSFQME